MEVRLGPLGQKFVRKQEKSDQIVITVRCVYRSTYYSFYDLDQLQWSQASMKIPNIHSKKGWL